MTSSLVLSCFVSVPGGAGVVVGTVAVVVVGTVAGVVVSSVAIAICRGPASRGQP